MVFVLHCKNAIKMKLDILNKLCLWIGFIAIANIPLPINGMYIYYSFYERLHSICYFHFFAPLVFLVGFLYLHRTHRFFHILFDFMVTSVFILCVWKNLRPWLLVLDNLTSTFWYFTMFICKNWCFGFWRNGNTRHYSVCHLRSSFFRAITL